MGDLELRIGRERGDHLVLRVLGRQHPGANDYWDGNWLVTPAELVVGCLRASHPNMSLRADTLLWLRKGLGEMHQSLVGEVEISSMEGTLVDDPAKRNVLSFEIPDLDQTNLAPMIAALDEMLAAYPVLGSVSS
ncbi:MAG: hypothetical protein ACKV2O_21300 [Acidimicrobiales bacterium]